MIKTYSYKISLEESKNLCKLISDNLKISDIILLNGDLGSGKTELIKNICANLNDNIYVSSPSFGIYHKYNLKKLSIWHYDLYRLDNEITEEELINLDFEEAITNNVVVIEWAERLNMEINNYILSIKIEYTQENMNYRNYKINFLEGSKWNQIFTSNSI